MGRVETPARLGGGWTDFFQEVELLKARTRSIKRIANRTFKATGKIFAPARNSTYKIDDLTRALIETCIRNCSAEQCSMPSPDTMLRRLHQVNEDVLGQVIRESNDRLLKRLCLRRRVMLAVDCRTLPYYGAEQPALVSDSRLPGTRLGIRFSTLSIIEAERTFTLVMRQVGPFTTKVEVLREMLKSIRGLVEPKIILLDRAFFAVEVIKEFKSKKKHFLMPAKRTAPIKRLCKAFEKGEITPVVDYKELRRQRTG